MNEAEVKKLRGILRKIDALKKEVEKLIGSDVKTPPVRATVSADATALINSIETLSASNLEQRLKDLSHKDLGDVFVAVGGTSGDKRKPKAFLIDRIVWLSKGFYEGHKSIRDS